MFFQHASYTGDNNIAVSVTHGVIHYLELVEVNHNNGERTAGARGPPPFGLQRLKKVAARLRAGQAIGNGLLLHALKDKRIVQRRRQQIGERSQNQYFLVCESVLLQAFDIQDAESSVTVQNWGT